MPMGRLNRQKTLRGDFDARQIASRVVVLAHVVRVLRHCGGERLVRGGRESIGRRDARILQRSGGIAVGPIHG